MIKPLDRREGELEAEDKNGPRAAEDNAINFNRVSLLVVLARALIQFARVIACNK